MPTRPPNDRSRVATLLLLVVAASAVLCPPAAAAPSDEVEPAPANASAVAGEPRIVELYPNPPTEENRGEYLVVSLPERGNWSLSDGYYDARIPANASGTVALSTAPNRTASILAASPETAVGPGTDAGPTDSTAVRRLSDYFPLSASGDRIELRRNGTAVDVVAYDRAREGYRWRAAWGEWRPRGYEPRSPRRTADAAVTPFVLPDSPGVPVEQLRSAEDRLFLAGYTLTSERVADALVAAADRGARVRVLLEGSPVGGFPARSARLLDRLTAAGVEVRILDGEVERFRFHHPKYAVADDRAVVLTENWKPSGTGGRSNRGWGVVVENGTAEGAGVDRNQTPADDLAALFAADFRAHDARPWREFRAETEFHGGGRANGSYPTRFEAPAAPATADVAVLTAPGNAADRIVARIDAADERVLAVVPRVGGPDDRIVRALRRAAERGVDVHLLLSDAWYDREANRNLSERLADEPIAVDLAAPRGRYGKVHAKGLVVDNAAVVGSLNWNPSAETNNREVLLAVENESVADFYARAYAADWRGGGIQLPVSFAAGFGVALAGAGAVARRAVAFG
ncbi:phospholipase D-like domain-containing protein [Halorubrum sp. 2020YC2]|uniref:phospholipase D-like domain-containing protein n=1 Tax=Halorubrum sp. 2020YC2 TaxID=2836432 RepID=UPI001BE72401|nr:phospholipase D-like domain-containing protein [Halorubrum sp. 2020YC2]QWC18704.1 phospholipase [Halorubrum sp. 2020YC2]